MTLSTQTTQDPPNQPEQGASTVVDQTALQIADMLDIDLSSVANAEQGTELAVNAVYDLVMKLHELSGNADQEGEEVDPNAAPEEGEEVDPNAAPEEGEVDPNAAPEEGEEEEEEFPPKKKKQAIAASFSPLMLSMAKENFSLKLDHLAETGCIQPHIVKEIKKQCLTDEAIGLALSNDQGPAPMFSFDDMVKLFSANGPTISFVEKTGHQSAINLPQGVKLELSEAEQKSAATNPLVADAESRK